MIRPLLTAAGLVLTSTTLALGAQQAAQAQDDSPWTLPVTPPRCTTEQANSGDVAGCLIAFWGEPYDDGYGHPPAPGVGDGWEWNGHTYAGSPALEEWESNYIAENADEVAGRGPGWLETHVAAQPLFEGFLNEISERGYRVRDASAYSFRCTNSNGGWNCPSGDPDDLSLHAYGLAVDMNASTNPIKRYTRINGRTACLTPMQTDMPQWMVQTAEKWGLYWGGYGWSSGCPDTTTERDSVFRDPPHFEFRGTPEMAAAIAAFNLGEDPNRVCFAVVDDDGDDAEACNRTGRPDAGWRIPVSVEAPEGTAAVMVNIAVTEAASRGHISLEDCGPRSGPRETAALTFAESETIATMAVVPLDESGRFCVYSNSSTHRVVDVLAFLSADGDRLWFDPSDPTRLTDTREVGTCNPQQECNDGPVSDGGEHAVPTADAAPRLTNVAVTESSARGYLQAGPCGDLGPERTFANLNYPEEITRSNVALLTPGELGACVFALRSTHVIVDELGRLDAESGFGWDLSASGRVLDTRECAEAWCNQRPEEGTTIRLQLDTDAPAVALAVTATESDQRGYIWVGPCSHLDERERPETSSLNHAPGQTVTNLALVDLEEGELCLFNRSATHIVIDLQAELVDEQAVGVVPTDPTRVHDSRER